MAGVAKIGLVAALAVASLPSPAEAQSLEMLEQQYEDTCAAPADGFMASMCAQIRATLDDVRSDQAEEQEKYDADVEELGMRSDYRGYARPSESDVGDNSARAGGASSSIGRGYSAATHCLSYAGVGRVENSCPFDVNFSFCYREPHSGSWATGLVCDDQSFGSATARANSAAGITGSSAGRLFFVGCEAPGFPRNVRWLGDVISMTGGCG